MDILEPNEPIKSNINLDLDSNTITSYFSYVINSLWNKFITINNDESLIFKDWEWLMDKDEKLDNKKLTQNKECITNELKEITKGQFMNNNFKMFILNYICNQNFDLKNTKLHSSNRSSLVKELIDKNLSIWLKIIKSFIYKHDIHESINNKNIRTDLSIIDNLEISNQLINISFSSSNLSENRDLDPIIICDIYWSIYLFLTKEISLVIPYNFHKLEYQHLINCMLQNTLSNFITSWTKMCSNVGNVNLRISRLSKIWNEDFQKEKLRLEQLKIDNLVDAKFNDNNEVVKIKDFNDKILVLDKLLLFNKTIKVIDNNEISSESFNSKKELLSNLLKFNK